MFSEREHFISYTKANNGQLVTIGGLNCKGNQSGNTPGDSSVNYSL